MVKGMCMAEGGVHGEGACMAKGDMHGEGGYVWRRWGGVCVAGETATAADGTHPTAMRSCFVYVD